MSAALPSVPPAAAVLPDLHSGTEFLTVTARPVLPKAVVIAVRGEVDLVIDLTGVDFFGAAGLTVLVSVRESAVAMGIRMCVVAHTRRVLLRSGCGQDG